MTWESLAKMNSTDRDELDEYMSRGDEAVLRTAAERKDLPIVIYGATGKFVIHVTEMLLRAVRELGRGGRRVHLIARFAGRERVEERLRVYHDLIVRHELDLLQAKAADLKNIPPEAWVIYGAGYKFVQSGEGSEEYARKCRLYGNAIPELVFDHHRSGAEIVVIGSASGLEFTPVHAQAGDDAPLAPRPGKVYGESIRDKEEVLKKILAAPELARPSRAVILRGAYFTDLTYGGVEPEILTIMKGGIINLGEKAYFNLSSHRDTARWVIRAVELAADPVAVYNLSGPTIDVREAAGLIAGFLSGFARARAGGPLRRYVVRFTGRPAEKHILADGSKLQEKLGAPYDSPEDIIRAQSWWRFHGGFSLDLNHEIGKEK